MKILLLAGTGEARRIARALATCGLEAVASLAGATRQPEPLALPTRIGGFGGEAGFRAYLADEGITAVLDATHPFAQRITERAARICAELGLAYLQVLRPAWERRSGEHWTEISTPAQAGAHIAKGATVFLATGRQSLAQFSGLEGRRVLLRVIDPPIEPFPFEGGEYVIGRPPFSVAREKALFEALQVDWLVVKNSGGEGGRAKLDAARALGIAVMVIARPALPDAPRVGSVGQAVEWAKAL